MKTKLAAVGGIFLLVAPGFAHRLDEYLQATIISVEKGRVQAFMRLVPGVAVFPVVLADIDTNRDGAISADEQQAYAERVLRDLALKIDGISLRPRLLSVDFPTVEQMKEGLGEIQINFSADLPAGGADRKLVIENYHQSAISAYLVNCLVPRDHDIRILAQNRNETQSRYELDYQEGGGRLGALSSIWSNVRTSLGGMGGIGSMFRLGMRHIAEGTDHLLFLLALLLPAPLIAFGSHWAGFAGVRQSFKQILKVVTAFTVGHSITLALAGFGLVHVPSRPIEVLIAVSILVSAIHALRPLFPGREAAIAAFFGLIHGLAFATTLGQLGLGRWERVASLLGFNLGIEAMQMIVVVAVMPSLVLLSRTCIYSFVRIGGGMFAGIASIGWIAERLLNLNGSVDVVVDNIAHHAVWIAATLFFVSVVSWSMPAFSNLVRTRKGLLGF